jgi:tryptophanyl-tRNA synthetase
VSDKPTLLSGIQTSADSLHLGNYVGALIAWREMQETHEAFFFLADLHAITVPQVPELLRENTRRTAAQFIAAGIDPAKSTVFIQSHVPAHAELAWVLGCLTGFGEASRMIQFKDKAHTQGTESTTVGLFSYPVLQASDILLYQPHEVPVGEDQRQHIELTRDLAMRFNSRFGDVFRVPEARIQKETAKIYDLQEPSRKMSKSTASETGLLRLLDEPSAMAKKIMRSVTDTETDIYFDRDKKPGIANLLTIFSVLSGRPIPDLENEFAGRGYGDLKKAVAEVVVSAFEPIRTRTQELLSDPAELDRILTAGAGRASEVAERTLAQVYDHVGFLPRP